MIIEIPSTSKPNEPVLSVKVPALLDEKNIEDFEAILSNLDNLEGVISENEFLPKGNSIEIDKDEIENITLDYAEDEADPISEIAKLRSGEPRILNQEVGQTKRYKVTLDPQLAHSVDAQIEKNATSQRDPTKHISKLVLARMEKPLLSETKSTPVPYQPSVRSVAVTTDMLAQLRVLPSPPVMPNDEAQAVPLIRFDPGQSSRLGELVLVKPSATSQQAGSPQHQVANTLQAMVRHRENFTEIRLTPEGMGSVRISLNMQDGGVVVAVHAERSDVQDQLRRNVMAFAADLEASGFEDISFSFGSEADSDGTPHDNAAGPDGSFADEPEEHTFQATSASNRPLDLKL